MATKLERPTNLDDALTQVTREIGQDVLEKTGGDSYRSGQPLRGHPDFVEPGTTPATPAPEPETKKAETTTVEEPKLFAGKYKSMEEWEKATLEAGNTISQLRRELDEKEGRLKIIEQTIQPQQKVEVVDPLDEVEQFGIPKEPFKKAMESTFKNMMREISEPYNARVQADQTIITKYPEYKDKFNDLVGWLAANPDVGKQVEAAENQGAYELAREFAWLKFTQNRGSEEETKLIDESKGQAKEKAQKLLDATVTDRKTGHTRDQSTAPKDTKTVGAEELERLKKLTSEGHDQRAWGEVFNPMLDPKLFE